MSEPIWAIMIYPSVEELKRLQFTLLQKQLNRVYRNSRFYRSKFEKAGIQPGDIKSLQDVPKIPFIIARTLIVEISNCLKA